MAEKDGAPEVNSARRPTIFISWSGDRSKAVALALREWLPMVIQSVDVWMSETDIAKGSRSMLEVMQKLSAADFGLICLTPENQLRPWILFEAGAIAKQ